MDFSMLVVSQNNCSTIEFLKRAVGCPSTWLQQGYLVGAYTKAVHFRGNPTKDIAGKQSHNKVNEGLLGKWSFLTGFSSAWVSKQGGFPQNVFTWFFPDRPPSSFQAYFPKGRHKEVVTFPKLKTPKLTQYFETQASKKSQGLVPQMFVGLVPQMFV